MTRGPDPNAPRLVVEVFRSSDKNAGVQTADAVRTRITQDVPVKGLWVLPKQDITSNLEASGFPTTEALNMSDARALAQLLRGDMFIVGQITRDSAGAGYNVDAQYVLTRDATLVQPMPRIKVSKPDQAAGAISKEFREIQKSFVSERTCSNAGRDGKWDVAIAAAKKGITEYPNSTLNRICLANALVAQKASPDSILAVTNEVLRIDPRSKPALTVAYDQLKKAGKASEATDVLLRLVGADPSNARLVEQVVNEFALSGQAPKAIPFVDQLVRDNQGDPNYLLLQMRVHLAAKDLKGGIAAGEELVKTDTAAATAELFTRLASAAAVDSQPQKAAELLARGVAKFPTNADLLVTYADVLRQAGQSQQAVDALDKALAANPKAPGLRTKQALIYADMKQTDKAIEVLQAAAAAGDSAPTVALTAVSIGQTLLKAAQASKAEADFQKTISVLEFANKTSATAEGQFILGAAAFTLGGNYLQQAQPLANSKSSADKAKACELAKNAQTQFATAQINLPAGGKFNPQTTQQLLTQLAQFSPYADQYVKALCK
ncbi:MAG: tetratricopeptide repeat protein [Gemmatirosa sp.]|nr:tetratricopeptide repeat protein [Gemmatirosa sp.]